MNNDRKKDALTELVDTAGSQSGESNNGRVSTPSGETVELGYDPQTKLDTAIDKLMEAARNYDKALKNKREIEILEYLIRREQKETNERKKTK